MEGFRGEGDDAIEQFRGDGVIERAEATVDAEDEVALHEDENVRDVGSVKDVGEGGFEIGRVLRANWIQALGDGEKLEDLGEDLGGVDVCSAGRGERVRAVQDDSRASELEGDPDVEMAGHPEESAAEFGAAVAAFFFVWAEEAVVGGVLEMHAGCFDEVHCRATGHPGCVGGGRHAEVGDS